MAGNGNDVIKQRGGRGKDSIIYRASAGKDKVKIHGGKGKDEVLIMTEGHPVIVKRGKKFFSLPVKERTSPPSISKKSKTLKLSTKMETCSTKKAKDSRANVRKTKTLTKMQPHWTLKSKLKKNRKSRRRRRKNRKGRKGMRSRLRGSKNDRFKQRGRRGRDNLEAIGAEGNDRIRQRGGKGRDRLKADGGSGNDRIRQSGGKGRDRLRARGDLETTESVKREGKDVTCSLKKRVALEMTVSDRAVVKDATEYMQVVDVEKTALNSTVEKVVTLWSLQVALERAVEQANETVQDATRNNYPPVLRLSYRT